VKKLLALARTTENRAVLKDKGMVRDIDYYISKNGENIVVTDPISQNIVITEFILRGAKHVG